jgi:predicted O-methyltransferase YrrM
MRQGIIDRIWRGHDPLHNLSANLFEFDIQGWNSQHAYLRDGILELRPLVVVEIGVWKGASSIFMAECLKQTESRGALIAVDTWLGSFEHWLAPDYHAQMSFLQGYPAMYHKFASNVVRAGVADYVVPLPIDSINAAHILRGHGIVPGMIHLDGAHDYESVMADLRTWWPLLAPGGLLVGDDYDTDGGFVQLRRAFDEFFAGLGYPALEHADQKCRVRKPW